MTVNHRVAGSNPASGALFLVTPMAAVTDVLLTLKQARDRRMAKSKLIEVIVARHGSAQREATTQAVEKMIAVQLDKGRIRSETKNGVEFLTAL